MESQAEEQSVETQKERKLRERNEQYSRQLEEELERLKVSGQTRDSEAKVSSSDLVWVVVRRMLTPHLLLHAVEAGWLLHSPDLCGPDSGGGTPARRLGEEDAAVRGGAGAQGSPAQRRAEGSAQRAARRREPTPCSPEGGPGSQRQAGENSP